MADQDIKEWVSTGPHDPLTDEDEQEYLFSVLDSFRQYRRTAHFNVTHVRRTNFFALPQKDQDLLKDAPFNLLNTFNRVDDAISANADLADAILDSALASMELFNANDETYHHSGRPTWYGKATKFEIDKARSTIHQLYRDWSEEGKSEREACYGPILKALAAYLPSGPNNGNPNALKVLVPGAGLGRLVFELSCAGYEAQGNEVSYHQLLASSFMLNHTTKAAQFPLYPWALSFMNVRSREDQLKRVMIPDVHPRSVAAPSSMSMITGDFSTVYNEDEFENYFDAIASVFFIDTATNLISYIRTVRHCLKENGLWINLGPLLWHASEGGGGRRPQSGTDTPSESQRQQRFQNTSSGSFELSDEEVVQMVQIYGFEVIKLEKDVCETGYMQNPDSMLQNIYKPTFWIARKLNYCAIEA